MASHFSVRLLILLLFISTPSFFAEESHPSVSDPIRDCAPWLLPLVPCAPFVQGSVASPGQLCCNNLWDINDQHPSCLCIFLNDPTFTYFPVNQTLALQLPLQCNLMLNSNTCSGSSTMTPDSPQAPMTSESPQAPMTPASPQAQAPISKGTGTSSSVAGSNLVTPESSQSPFPKGTDTNSSAAVSPVVAFPPVSKAGLGISRSSSTKLKTKEDAYHAAAIISILAGVVNWF
ncbi:Bifunctional inhibitor/lipid-transfer protein/seed storage 2S albumin superfamily protein [Thalictrum thalictroides]|uniref:Bifunctional inhibitor/lipid-transfer protein/seed storage 2S albumin superfamily protein n=1 Tax=Thalictrum thalictroides TaxID=46969 RepID=A0A7J6VH28_THATH|nr:Bifunctional inhibitor/lipid-transfer protein/seed storage 2S albumin superfamily protein [Thalictrum thalictroides]